MDSPRHILVLCDYQRSSATTIRDHARSLARHSQDRVSFLNTVGLEYPSWLSLDCFDVVVIHYSVYLLDRIYLAPSWHRALEATSALKVLFLQDEYRKVEAFHERILTLGIDVLFTMVPEASQEYVYPKEKLPDLTLVRTLAGYAPDYLAEHAPDLESPRPIDVGYRARGKGLWWLGQLFQEKRLIGEGFRDRAASTDLVCDISMEEKDRIYGDAWLQFLRSCRCTLGSETGASVIDFTGEVEASVREYEASDPEASFEGAQKRFFAHLEGKVEWDNLSPRVFEATGAGCGLILFRGRYGGALEPDVHYIPLEKDFSNFDEVLERLRDDDGVKAMVRRAYEDLILSGRFSYRTMVREFDEAIEAALAARPARTPPPLPRRGTLRAAGRFLLEVGRWLMPWRHFSVRNFLRSIYYRLRVAPELIASEFALLQGKVPESSPAPTRRDSRSRCS